jgi:hypothetical protein
MGESGAGAVKPKRAKIKANIGESVRVSLGLLPPAYTHKVQKSLLPAIELLPLAW